MKYQQKPQRATSAFSSCTMATALRSPFFATRQTSRDVFAFTARITSNSVPFLHIIPKSNVGTNECLIAARKKEPYPYTYSGSSPTSRTNADNSRSLNSVSHPPYGHLPSVIITFFSAVYSEYFCGTCTRT